jgi:hypothetical protein
MSVKYVWIFGLNSPHFPPRKAAHPEKDRIWAIIELTSNTLEKKYVGTFKISKMSIGWEQKTNH